MQSFYHTLTILRFSLALTEKNAQGHFSIQVGEVKTEERKEGFVKWCQIIIFQLLCCASYHLFCKINLDMEEILKLGYNINFVNIPAVLRRRRLASLRGSRNRNSLRMSSAQDSTSSGRTANRGSRILCPVRCQPSRDREASSHRSAQWPT